MLGESYRDLRDEALSELHLLLIRKVEELQRHPSPEKWVVTATKYIAIHVKAERAKHLNNFSDTDMDEILFTEDVFEMETLNSMIPLWKKEKDKIKQYSPYFLIGSPLYNAIFNGGKLILPEYEGGTHYIDIERIENN